MTCRRSLLTPFNRLFFSTSKRLNDVDQVRNISSASSAYSHPTRSAKALAFGSSGMRNEPVYGIETSPNYSRACERGYPQRLSTERLISPIQKIPREMRWSPRMQRLSISSTGFVGGRVGKERTNCGNEMRKT